MRVEEVGRELQRIGDDYNDHLLRVSVRAVGGFVINARLKANSVKTKLIVSKVIRVRRAKVINSRLVDPNGLFSSKRSHNVPF